jgi:predicted transcriptional regulator
VGVRNDGLAAARDTFNYPAPVMPERGGVLRRREALSLDQGDLEVVDILASLGVDHKIAKVITFLAQVEEGKSTDIERGCRLRQPEVSVATKSLRELGWIQTEERKKGGKGRPVHYYKLQMPLPKIIDVIERDKRREIENELAKIEKLKSRFTG